MASPLSLSRPVIRGGWSKLKYNGSFIPPGRSSTAISLIRSSLYVFSGERIPRQPVDGDVHILNLETLNWNSASKSKNSQSPWPCPRVGHAGTSVGTRFFIQGGRTAYESEATLSDLWAFDTLTQTWDCLSPASSSSSTSSSSSSSSSSSIISSVGSPALSYHTLTSSPTHLYAFGGCTDDHGRSNKIYSYSLENKNWSLLADSSKPNGPSPRGGPGFAYLSGKLYCFGGYNGKEELNDFYEFDLESKNWTEIKNSSQESTSATVTPAPRSVTDLVALPNLGERGSLGVFGGEYTPSASGHEGAGEYHRDTYVYLVAERQWVKVNEEDAEDTDRPTARGWMNTVAGEDGKSMIVYGGFDGKERVGDAYKLTFRG